MKSPMIQDTQRLCGFNGNQLTWERFGQVNTSNYDDLYLNTLDSKESEPRVLAGSMR